MLDQNSVLRLLGVGLLLVLIIVMLVGRGIKKSKRPKTAQKAEDSIVAVIAAAINEYKKYNYGQPVFITAQKAEDNITAAIAAAINEYRKHN